MKDKTLSCIGLFTMAIVAIALSSVMHGWVLSTLWGWFVAPIFGLPPIPVAVAIGLSLIIGLLTTRTTDSKHTDKADFWNEAMSKILAEAIFSPLFYLLIGYIVHGFM